MLKENVNPKCFIHGVKPTRDFTALTEQARKRNPLDTAAARAPPTPCCNAQAPQLCHLQHPPWWAAPREPPCTHTHTHTHCIPPPRGHAGSWEGKCCLPFACSKSAPQPGQGALGHVARCEEGFSAEPGRSWAPCKPPDTFAGDCSSPSSYLKTRQRGTLPGQQQTTSSPLPKRRDAGFSKAQRPAAGWRKRGRAFPGSGAPNAPG